MQENKKLNEILTKLMHEFKIDDRKLSQKTNISFQLIAKLRTNQDINPTLSTLTALSNFFDISISQLIGQQKIEDKTFQTIQNDAHNSVPHNKEYKVPIINYTEFTFSNIVNLNKNILWMQISKINIGENVFAIRINNNSINNLFRNNSILVVDPDIKPNDNDYVICMYQNEIIICRIQNKNNYIPLNEKFNMNTKNYSLVGTIIEIKYNLI